MIKQNRKIKFFLKHVLHGTHSGAVVGDRAAACQAGVKVGDAVGAADWRILVHLTATVHVTAACQVPVSQRQSWPERWGGHNKLTSFP